VRMIGNRKKLRLDNFDYASDGFYFITICAYQNKNIFGNIVRAGPCAGPNSSPCADPKIELNNIGNMIKSAWDDIPKFYPNAGIDEFIIMPNHVHGIIILSNIQGRPQGGAPTLFLSLSDVVHRFKSLTTTYYCRISKQSNKLWQRSFYDHIIRNEHSLQHIREYILNNPTNWARDEYHN